MRPASDGWSPAATPGPTRFARSRPKACGGKKFLKIVVGLGNPGKQYEQTRHNVGWMVLDRLAERAGWRAHARRAMRRRRSRPVQGLDLMLAKPTTYMNLSGVAVRKVLARQRAPMSDMLVVVDDFDLPLGKLRMRGEGSAGAHNGLRSIIAELGTQEFARLRVGIGEPRAAARRGPRAEPVHAGRAAAGRRGARRRCRRRRGLGARGGDRAANNGTPGVPPSRSRKDRRRWTRTGHGLDDSAPGFELGRGFVLGRGAGCAR